MQHYEEIRQLLLDTQQEVRIRYTELYRILCCVLVEGTADSQMDFSGPFARFTFLASKLELDNGLRWRINSFRGKCKELELLDTKELAETLKHDIRTVCELMEAVEGEPMPRDLKEYLPKGDSALYRPRQSTDYLRICVTEVGEQTITGLADNEIDAEPCQVCISDEENHFGDWAYLKPLLKRGSQVNVVRPELREGIYYPELIILEPDYLADISSIAACFQEYGSSPYVHLINRIKPQVSSPAILLGNLAGQMLDEEVNATRGEEPAYAQTITRFMQHNALAILAQGKMTDFHTEAQMQQQNIRQLLKNAEEEDKALCREHLLLEPSFFCEMLGLQGRMDLLQDDFRVLMEQKSGKKDLKTMGHKEGHYVQMLLYQALLHYSRNLRNDEISSYLLYSKYPDGLIKEGPAPKLLFEALKIRNQMVWCEFQMSQGGSRMLDRLTPERMNTNGLNTRLWEQFIRPQIASTLDTLQQATPLAQAYVHRMLQFVAKEHLLGKIGTPGREASGMAALWNCTLEEKLVAGSILLGLHIVDTRGENGAVDTIWLKRPPMEEKCLPNFRVGDICIFYAYPEEEVPDARKAILFRASIENMDAERICVRLRATQHNPRIFTEREGHCWAIEPDFTESSFGALYHSIFNLLNATPDRRDLLLGQRKAETDESLTLKGDYSLGGSAPHFNQLVLQAKRAKDFFILIGPPGTGKTSFGLMNILHETLDSSEEGVLLLSYTNRAVDEICSKLVEHGLDFVRMGAPQSCPENYRPYLLGNRVKECGNLLQISEIVKNHKIIVGTTTTVTSQQDIFKARSFGLAIIDEASQILEPHLLGILCAKHKGGNAVKKFVMIGDHKQLPAVVQQNVEESAVKEPALNEIGLMDCRESLFQRLLRKARGTALVFQFTHQGRMHPEVAEFANQAFYAGKLLPIPLPHQQKKLDFPKADSNDPWQKMLAKWRVVFVPSEKPFNPESPKVNEVEAKMAAETARSVYLLYTRHGKPFLPSETIGIIVPYRHQIAKIRQLIGEYGIPELEDITIDTVERYQGSQRDVIIYGMTVQHPYQLEFLCSQSFEEDGKKIDRKLNVALTRAREQMVLIGNPELLGIDDTHRRLMEFVGQNCSR